MLTFVGLGLYDEKDITIKGLEAVRNADIIFAEFYTSALMGTAVSKLEELYGKKIRVLTREDVESRPVWLDEARNKNVVFISGGDAMVATTHVDLRLRAKEEGIETRIIHAPSIISAVCGLTGLQNYRFGKSTTIPFPYRDRIVRSPLDTVVNNLRSDLHSLVFLDIDRNRGYMTIHDAIELLLAAETRMDDRILEKKLFVGVARAGSLKPEIKADYPMNLKNHDFGDPLHILVIPASLHVVEAEALVTFAGAPAEILQIN